MILMRKHELYLTLILGGILVGLLLHRPLIIQALAVFIGTGMATLEYICIQFGMWKYFNTKTTIPAWLTPLWIATVLFIYDMFHVFGSSKNTNELIHRAFRV